MVYELLIRIIINQFRLMTLFCIPFIDYALCIWVCKIRRWRKLISFLRSEFHLIWIARIQIRISSIMWSERWFSRLSIFIWLAVVMICLIISCWCIKWLPLLVRFISIAPFSFRWIWFLRLSLKLSWFSLWNLRIIVIIHNLADFLLNWIT